MNREQKIALIIGFAVILVVGVLVSDHLSAAQRLDIADATEGDTGRVEARPVAVLPDPGTSRYASGPTGVREPRETRDYAMSTPAPTPAFEPVEEVADEPLRITLGDRNSLGDALELASERQAAERRAGGSDSPTPITTALRDFGGRVADGLRDGLPAATRVETEGAVSGLDTRRVTAPVRAPLPKPVRHTVRKDESLYKIAARYLGDGNRWREIARANGERVSENGGVREGVTLVIPNAKAVIEPIASPRTGGERSPVAKPASKAPTTYTVAKNDSLGKIAQDLLGSVRYMDEIILANPGKISDPDDIRVGMVLRIPAKS